MIRFMYGLVVGFISSLMNLKIDASSVISAAVSGGIKQGGDLVEWLTVSNRKP